MKGTRDVETRDDVVFFKSNLSGEYQLLSNFADLSEPLKVDGKIYPTLEHAYQAAARLKEDEKHLMQVGGRLATWEGFGTLVKSYKKPTHGLLGWMAKVAVNKKYSKEIGLRMGAKRMEKEEALALINKMLNQKFSAMKEQAVLLSTGDKYLLELDSRAGEKSVWGGKAVYEAGNKKRIARIVGENELGKMLMKVRYKILQRMKKVKKET